MTPITRLGRDILLQAVSLTLEGEPNEPVTVVPGR
jgi:hypothetical protein